ncbi:hypothetical protein Tco_0782186 [Tanacetum coccineum]
MTRSYTESKTSLAIATNLSKLELKKILIEKMESNRSIYKSNEQKNLYKGSKRRRAEKEPESTSALKEKTSKTTGKSTDGSKSQHKSAGESAHTEEPMHTAHTEEPMHTDKDLEEPAHHEFDIRATEEQSDEETSQHPDGFKNHNLAREEGPRESFDELIDTPLDFSAFMMNRLKINTLTPELLVGLTFELMKGQQYPHDLRKPLLLIPDKSFHLITSSTTTLCIYLVVSPVVLMKLLSQRPRLQIKVISNGLKIWSPTQSGMNCRESTRDVYSKRRIIAVIKLQIVEWYGYKHLDWITVHRDDDKLYTLKEGDFKRLRL